MGVHENNQGPILFSTRVPAPKINNPTFINLPNPWTENQRERAKIRFKEYQKLKEAYNKVKQFRRLYETKTREKAKTKFKKWIREIKYLKRDEFNTVSNPIQNHLADILNLLINRSTNAHADSFNVKIKLCRANLRGVSNTTFAVQNGKTTCLKTALSPEKSCDPKHWIF